MKCEMRWSARTEESGVGEYASRIASRIWVASWVSAEVDSGEREKSRTEERETRRRVCGDGGTGEPRS